MPNILQMHTFCLGSYSTHFIHQCCCVGCSDGSSGGADVTVFSSLSDFLSHYTFFALPILGTCPID